MDFLYADLNEMVDPFAYSVEKKDNTINLSINNENRTLSATVVHTPGSLLIKDGNSSISFNGMINKQVEIPKYIIKEVQPSNGDVRRQYSLMTWDYDRGAYVSIDGCDAIYLDEQLDELNIQNGVKDTTVIQVDNKLGTGKSNISSTSYIYDGIEDIDSLDIELPTQKMDYSGSSESITGLRVSQVLQGGKTSGVQSVSFGGQAFGISGQFIITVKYENIPYRFNVISEKPLVLRKTIGGETYIEQNGSIRFPDLGDDGLDFFIIRNSDGSVKDLALVQAYLRDVVELKISRGYSDYTTANGNQSISVGGGTHADYSWSQSFGLGTSTSSAGQMVVGAFNKDNPDALFVVGNGEYNVLTGEITKSNALQVLKDGTVLVGDGDTVVTVSKLNQQIGAIDCGFID